MDAPGPEGRPGWIDRVLGAVERLPGPAWLAYLVALIVLLAASHLVAWAEGSVGAWQADAYRASLAGYMIAPMAMIHYFHALAPVALRRFRPALASDEQAFLVIGRDLSRLPAGPTVVWAFAGLIVAAAYIAGVPDQAARLQEQPLTFGFDLAVTLLSFPVASVFGYHTIRQLRQVARIHDRASISISSSRTRCMPSRS